MIKPFAVVLTLLALFSPILLAADSPALQSKALLRGIPVSFEKNVGQMDARYTFIANRQGMRAAFRNGGVDFEIAGKSGRRVQFPVEFGKGTSHAYAEGSLPGKVNYLLGSDSSRWLTSVDTYEKIRYQGVFPGIDLVFYGNAEEIEHDFVVAAGSDPSLIRMRLSPDAVASVSADGLFLSRGDAVLKFKQPLAYQETPEGRKLVNVAFSLKDHTLGFEVGRYDRDLPLVIDPALVFSTFIADTYSPVVGIATDSDRDTYIIGYTSSSSLPVYGAIQPTCNNCPNSFDIFVVKLNASGTTVLYSTYFGGSGNDTPVGIQVDQSGNILFAGQTESSDFPLKNGMDGTPSYAQPVGFVTSLARDGSSLNYSTMLGHTQQGRASGAYLSSFAIGPDGSAYVTGNTFDPNFPVTPGAINALTPGYPTAPTYLSRFLPNGALAYSAILGVTNGIAPHSLVVDSQGAAYLDGSADASWPTTEGSYQPTLLGSTTAPFVTKVKSDGSALIYSTFLGTGGAPAGIAVNSSGEAWVTGLAGGTFPTTPDAFKGQIPSGTSAYYLARLSADGKQLLYSTYTFLSGDYPAALLLDSAENVWMSGTTQNTDIPFVRPLQTLPQPSWSNPMGFIAEFDPTGKSILFSSYLGAPSGTSIQAMAMDSAGMVHVAGSTGQDLYTTPGVYLDSVTAPSASYRFPFVAVIDPAADSPVVCVTSPSSGVVNLAPTLVGTTRSSSITMKNCGTTSLDSASFGVNDSQLAIPPEHNNCTGTLASGATCSFQLDFTPTAEASLTGRVTITSAAKIPPAIVTVYGAGATPHARLPWDKLFFYPLLLGQSWTQSVYVESVGSVPLHVNVSGLVITGDYSFRVKSCPAQTYGGSCVIDVTFTPTAVGTREGSLTIPTDDPAHPTLTVTFSGSAVSSYPVPVLSSVDYGTAPIGGTDVTVYAYGSGFFRETVVKIDGNSQATTFQSDTTLRFKVDPALLTRMGELKVTVSNPTPGGGESSAATLTTYKVVPGHFRHMVYNKATQLLYVTVPHNSPADVDTVLIIDPKTGQTAGKISVGNSPDVLALSSDDQYLFVGLSGENTVQRINCVTKAVEKTYTMPTGTLWGHQDTADQIVAVPGAPKSFVVRLSQNVSTADGIALFNDGGMVSHIGFDYPGYLEFNSVSFAGDPNTIYAMPFDTTGTPFFRMITIDSTGLHVVPSSGQPGNPGLVGWNVVTDGTLLYTDEGFVFNPLTKSQVGKIDVITPFAVVLPDPADAKVFALAEFDMTQSNYSAMSIGAYKSSDYSLLTKLYFRTVTSAQTDLVRWGTDGLAFLSGEDYNLTPSSFTSINILRSSIVNGALTDFSLDVGSGGSSTASVAAGQPATYKLSLSPQGGFSGTVLLGCTGAPQYATCTVSPSSANLGAGGSVTIAVNISTTQNTSSAMLHPFGAIWAGLFVAGLVSAVRKPARRSKARSVSLLLAFAIAGIVALSLTACGGGGSTTTPPPPPAPAVHNVAPGTYTLTVTASSGGTQKSIPITLVVR